MKAAEYIQDAQDLLEFQLKVSRYYTKLWNEFPWLVTLGEDAPRMFLTVCTPLGSDGAYNYDSETGTLLFDENGLTFNEAKSAIFKPFVLAIMTAGARYLELVAAGHKTSTVIDYRHYSELVKGYKWNMKGLCKAFDDAVQVALKEL